MNCGWAMGKSRIVAITLMAAMALSSSNGFGSTPVAAPVIHHSNPVVPYVIFGCAGSLVLAAFIANIQRKRQLTPAEAATCGLLFWFTPPINSIDTVIAGSRIRF